MRSESLFCKTRSKRFVSFLLACAMLFVMTGYGPSAPVLSGQLLGEGVVKDAIAVFSDSQLNAYSDLLSQTAALSTGMVGFVGENRITPESDEPVSVIVEFVHAPATTLRMEQAFSIGSNLPADEALRAARNDHDRFLTELGALFANPAGAQMSQRTSQSYIIENEYHNAINGVAITVPASKVADIAAFDSVRAVYPNVVVSLDEPLDYSDMGEIMGDMLGGAVGREDMNADRLHSEGYTGAGVTVCIIDTGIDYNHPAFSGAFLDYSPRGNDEADLINGVFYGRNFHKDVEKLKRPDNDPMETTYNNWVTVKNEYNITDLGSRTFFTVHGTQVAGIVAARDYGENLQSSALGMAPEAFIYAYRALGQYSTGYASAVLAALEFLAYDKPDVVNMSMGFDSALASYLVSVAVNNTMIANPDMVFAIANGNTTVGGMMTVTSPATSATAISVGNATGAVRKMTVELSSAADAAVMYLDAWSGFEKNASGIWLSTYGGLIPVNGAAGSYKVVPLPLINSNSSLAAMNIGGGTAEEFAAAEDIAGNIVLVGRGRAILDTMQLAVEYGAGAVILVDYQNPDGPNEINYYRSRNNSYLPCLSVSYADGAALLEALDSNKYELTITGYSEQYQPPAMNNSSAAGPVKDTYDIVPDIMAHGTAVMVASPPWALYIKYGYPNLSYDYTYVGSTGTSMSSPHIAGAAALMVQYGKENGGRWTASEIKARLMNTAYPLAGHDSVYETGAGYADVYAAAHADAYITVGKNDVYRSGPEGDNVSSDGHTDTGSLSFGTFTTGRGGGIKTLAATIHNSGNTAKTFSVSHVFNTTSQSGNINVANATSAGITLSYPGNVYVGTVSESKLDFTVNVPSGLSGEQTGSYEGYVALTNTADPTEVYKLPFALYVTEQEMLPSLDMSNTFLNRPLISTGENRQNYVSSYLDVYFTLTDSTVERIYVYLANEELDVDNLAEKDILAYLAKISTAELNTGELYFSNVFEGTYIPYSVDKNAENYLDESVLLGKGSYNLLLVSEGSDGYQYFALPFIVDNDRPAVTISGADDGGVSIGVEPGASSYTIKGNVFDEGLFNAANKGFRFDLWNDEAPMSNEIDQRYNALFVTFDGKAYQKVDVNASGDFSININMAGKKLPLDLTLLAYDAYSIIDLRYKDIDNEMITKTFEPDKLLMYTGSTNLAWIGSNKLSVSLKLYDKTAAAKTITGHVSLDTVELDTDEHIMDLDGLVGSGKLPREVTLTTAAENVTVRAAITGWEGTFDGQRESVYSLTAKWALPDGYVQGAGMPAITAVVQVNVTQTPKLREITGYIPLQDITLTEDLHLLDFTDLMNAGILPKTVALVLQDESTIEVDITGWRSCYDGSTTGSYTSTALWDVPDGYALSGDIGDIMLNVAVNVRQTPVPKVIDNYSPLDMVTLDEDEHIVSLVDLKASGKLPDTVTVYAGRNQAEARIKDWSGDFDGGVETDYTLVAIVEAPEGFTFEGSNVVITAEVSVQTAQTDLEGDRVITGYTAFDDIYINTDRNILTLDDLINSSLLPAEVELLAGNFKPKAAITGWTGDFDGTNAKTYTLTAIWSVPDGYVLQDNNMQVQVTVHVNMPQTRKIIGFQQLDDVIINSDEHITSMALLKASGMLPQSVYVTADNVEYVEAQITNWSGSFDGSKGVTTLTAVWGAPDGYSLSGNTFTVTVDVNVNVAQTNPLKIITGCTQPDDVTLSKDEHFLTLADLIASGKLPAKVELLTAGGDKVNAAVTGWTGAFDGAKTGEYTITAQWNVPSGYKLDANGVTVTVKVLVTTAQTPVKKEFTVAFVTNGGTAVSPLVVTEGGFVTAPVTCLEGYDFAGWYTNQALTKPYDFSSPVTSDLTLYAKWFRRYYTVTFNSNGGAAVSNQIIAHGDKISPVYPVRNGYYFDGWYSDASLTIPYNTNAAVTGSLTLYAGWTPVGSYDDPEPETPVVRPSKPAPTSPGSKPSGSAPSQSNPAPGGTGSTSNPPANNIPPSGVNTSSGTVTLPVVPKHIVHGTITRDESDPMVELVIWGQSMWRGELVINIGSYASIQLSGAALSRIADTGKSLVIVNDAMKIILDTDVISQLLGLISDANGTVDLDGIIEIGMLPVREVTVPVNIVGDNPVNNDTLNLTADVRIQVNGLEIKKFNGLVKLAFNMSGIALSEGQKARLTAVRILPDGSLNQLGGQWEDSYFVAGTYDLSMYSVIVSDTLTTIVFGVGEKQYTVNGVTYTADVEPFIYESRTMVPVRFIAEAFGAEVGWDDASKTVLIQLDGQTITLTAGLLEDGMDVAPLIQNDRVMLPLRYVSEMFGSNVLWDSETRKATIYR